MLIFYKEITVRGRFMEIAEFRRETLNLVREQELTDVKDNSGGSCVCFCGGGSSKGDELLVIIILVFASLASLFKTLQNFAKADAAQRLHDDGGGLPEDPTVNDCRVVLSEMRDERVRSTISWTLITGGTAILTLALILVFIHYPSNRLGPPPSIEIVDQVHRYSIIGGGLTVGGGIGLFASEMTYRNGPMREAMRRLVDETRPLYAQLPEKTDEA